MQDRLLFTLLTSTVAGVSAALAARLSEYLWVQLTHRDPPQRIASLNIVGMKLGRGLLDRLGTVVSTLRARS